MFSGGRNRIYWKCKCDCGNEKWILSSKLSPFSKDKTKSCGCIQKETIANINYKHGEANKTKENRIWRHMQGRCYCKTDAKYKNYGGRGIKVCDRWLNSYQNFLEDMGRCPKGCSIHRIENDGNYEPKNCKWADNYEQANEKTTSVFIEYDGLRLTLKQWSTKLGFKYKWFHSQVKYKNKTINELANGRF